MKAHTDEDILALIKNKSTENKGFKLLMNTFQEQLYGLIYRMCHNHTDTDDILQNTFIKAFKGIQKFKGNSKLSTWLYRIATNESLTFLKKRKKNQTNAIEGSTNFDLQMKTGNQIEESKIVEYLKEAVEKLPEKQRLIFTLRYYQEMSYKEIAQILNTSVGGLKANYHHAVKKVEQYIKNTNIVY